MNGQQKTLDYEQEVQKLKDLNYWNEQKGTFQITFLEELSEMYQSDFIKKDGTKEPRWKTKTRILVNDKEFIWTINKAETKSSLYGQLVQLASQSNGKLTGVNATIIIKYDGKKRDFTIAEVNQ